MTIFYDARTADIQIEMARISATKDPAGPVFGKGSYNYIFAFEQLRDELVGRGALSAAHAATTPLPRPAPPPPPAKPSTLCRGGRPSFGNPYTQGAALVTEAEAAFAARRPLDEAGWRQIFGATRRAQTAAAPRLDSAPAQSMWALAFGTPLASDLAQPPRAQILTPFTPREQPR